MIKAIKVILIIFIIGMSIVVITKTSTVYTSKDLGSINKVYDIAEELCSNNGGVDRIRYNFIFHHKLHCNNGTVIKYAGKVTLEKTNVQ